MTPAVGRPLQASDPRWMGGYRLLRRIGEGSTGVLYLARSAGGAAVAVRAIRPRHARNAGFRVRFEREVTAARHLSARCVVPVTAAGTTGGAAGGTLWLASPYVPGPSLGAAVAAYGPLPAGTVRELGRMLAGALRAVHGDGLVHRDVKPRNVLLTGDGPRLAGLGTARPFEGTPGYGSPEQALGVAGGRPCRAGDVFSLGCVLAYAVTGRPPFGTGTDSRLRQRALDGPPDLADVPRSLLELLQACCEADPELRPTPGDLEHELTGSGPGEGVPGWLPEPVAREVAERAALCAVLPGEAQPPARGGAAGRDGAGDPSGTRPGGGEGNSGGRGSGPPYRTVSRRRLLGLASTAGALATGGVLADRVLSGGGGDDKAPEFTLGLHADLTGPQARYGRGQRSGVIIAFEELQEHGSLPFRLRLKILDDGGVPARAAEAAGELSADPSVLAVIGPTSDAVAGAAGRYSEAGVPLISLSVGTFGDRSVYRTLLHARPGTGHSCLCIPDCLTGKLRARRVGLVDDRTAGVYSRETTRAVSATIDRSRVELLSRVLPAGTENFVPLARWLLDREADAVVYGGYADGAAGLADALHSAGFSGSRLATQEARTPRFLRQAGAAAEGWRFLTTYTDPEAPETAESTAAHRKRFGGTPEPYAAEGYDAARMIVTALRDAAADDVPLTRGILLGRLREARHGGVARSLAFDSAGNYAGDGPLAYFYQVRGGRFRYVGKTSLPEPA